MVTGIYELPDPSDNWLIVVEKRSGETIHGHSTIRSVIATTNDKSNAQTIVEALRKHYNIA